MVQQYFSDLTGIAGIEAVVIFDNQNNIVDSWALPKYNLTVFSELGETFMHVFGLIEHLDYDMEEIVMPFDRGLVYAKSQEKFSIVVIARLSVEVSLIRLALNVNLQEFHNIRKVRRLLKKLPDQKFYQIKSSTLDDVEKIMLENILEGGDDDGAV